MIVKELDQIFEELFPICRSITGEGIREKVQKLNFDELPSGMIQKSSGKIFRSSDWRPDHLKIIYEQYQDKIVDLTISKEISGRIPKLISVI